MIEHDTPPFSQFVKAGSYCSSSSEVLSSSSPLDNEFSQLVIDHDKQPSSRLARAENRRSSLSDAFNSNPSLDNLLSQLVIDEYGESQPTIAESSSSRQVYIPNTPPPRPASATSHYSSSSEVLSSVPDSLHDDEVFSQPAVEEETPPSSQSTAQSSQPPQTVAQSTQSTHITESSIPITEVYEPEEEAEAASSPHNSDPPSPTASTEYNSPSSTGKLSATFPSPVLSPTRPAWHSEASTSTSPSAHSPRLYRTRSGNLASLSELRQRREREGETLDVVLRGIPVPGEARTASRRSVPMSQNENGRWRINSIREPWGP